MSSRERDRIRGFCQPRLEELNLLDNLKGFFFAYPPWVTRARAFGRSGVRSRVLARAVAVVVMITAQPLTWTSFSAQPLPAPLAPVVAAAPIPHEPSVSAAYNRPDPLHPAGVAPRPRAGPIRATRMRTP